jgi:hypothetical protein
LLADFGSFCQKFWFLEHCVKRYYQLRSRLREVVALSPKRNRSKRAIAMVRPDMMVQVKKRVSGWPEMRASLSDPGRMP